jgi:hypothetical protein
MTKRVLGGDSNLLRMVQLDVGGTILGRNQDFENIVFSTVPTLIPRHSLLKSNLPNRLLSIALMARFWPGVGRTGDDGFGVI